MQFTKIVRTFEDGLGEVYAEFIIDDEPMLVNVTNIRSEIISIKKLPTYVNIEFERNYLGLINIVKIRKVGALDIFFNFANNIRKKKSDNRAKAV